MKEKTCIGYKMVRLDGTAFHDSTTKYEVGAVLLVKDATADGKPCGHGLHLAKERHGPMKYNAVWPWRLFECSYSEEDIVGQDADKVRVIKLRVEKELDPTDIGLPRANQFFDRLDRLSKYSGLKAQTPARKKKITKTMHEYVKRLNAHPAANGRTVVLNKVAFHGIAEWDSVRGSVWSSVRDSVRDSVRGSVWSSARDSVMASVWDSVMDSVMVSVWDSVWASARDSVWASARDSARASVTLDDISSPFLPEHDILDYGAVLYGIDNDGVAHVIMPTKEEIAHDR